MRRVLPTILLFMVALLGFWVGGGGDKEKKKQTKIFHPERNYPVQSEKPFVFIVYARNDAPWCERTLRSIFEQSYESFRVVFIDDASSDGTSERARSFVVSNSQDHRVIMIRNEESLGKVACLYRAMDPLSDAEIAIPIDAKDWLAQEMVLKKLNQAYQNPDVWMTLSPSLAYPSYSHRMPTLSSFFAAVFKQIRLSDLYDGEFVRSNKSWIDPLMQMAGGRCRILTESLTFCNETRPIQAEPDTRIVSYEFLSEFPRSSKQSQRTGVDLVLFSFNRPLQLYACLESVSKYFTGSSNIAVLYRASDEKFLQAYETVRCAFPNVRFVRHDSKRDFKKKMMALIYDSHVPYVIFGVDDIVVKDTVDLTQCVRWLEKTGAYAFFLRLGHNITFCYMNGKEQAVPQSIALGSGTFAWDFRKGESDWNFPNNLDMTLYRKADLKYALNRGKIETPNSMEQAMHEVPPKPGAIGLYFEQSKIVNLPLNIVHATGNPHMNYMSSEELLSLFDQGLKMNINPFYRIENRSPHFEQIPEFIPR